MGATAGSAKQFGNAAPQTQRIAVDPIRVDAIAAIVDQPFTIGNGRDARIHVTKLRSIDPNAMGPMIG